MPTKDSRVIGVRLNNEIIEKIMARALRRHWTFNRWMNWATLNGLRSHKRRSQPENDDYSLSRSFCFIE